MYPCVSFRDAGDYEIKINGLRRCPPYMPATKCTFDVSLWDVLEP